MLRPTLIRKTKEKITDEHTRTRGAQQQNIDTVTKVHYACDTKSQWYLHVVVKWKAFTVKLV